MDLLGNLANLKVDTVLSAVDKYVPGECLTADGYRIGQQHVTISLHAVSGCLNGQF
jgi:hypothetical protein